LYVEHSAAKRGRLTNALHTFKSAMKKVFQNLFDVVEKMSSQFLSFAMRPKQAHRIGTFSDTVTNLPKMAIVIQGGLLLKENFTLETVKLYKQLYKDVLVIVSTWEDSDSKAMQALETAGAVLVKSKKPADFGQQNINLQLVSALAGVEKAQELGAEYVLKTRTDQRMYAPNAMEYLYNITQTFGVCGSDVQTKRIVGVSLNTFKYRMYGLSDMNIFGTVQDMLKYCGAKLDVKTDDSVGPMSLPKPLCEVYLATEFLKSVGRDIAWTVEDSWDAFRDHFVVVDEESLDLYWYKYARMREYRYPQYDTIKNNQQLSFREWFNIYANRSGHVPKDVKEVII